MNPIFLFHPCARRSAGKSFFSVSVIVLGLTLTIATLGLSSCGTARGFGSDLERAGEEIEEAASR
jgi:predicted small secreted protein